MRPAAAALAAAAIAAGASAAIVFHGHAKQSAQPARRAPHGGPEGVHGLMLFPLADPDAHARNGAQAQESAP